MKPLRVFIGWLCVSLCPLVSAAETNRLTPVTARDFFYVGNERLAEKKFPEAERMFQTVLATQDERIRPFALFNLGHVRFAEGAAILARGPDAQKTLARGKAALNASGAALGAAESSLADQQLDRMVAAYVAGRGARRELRAAEKAVKSALEIYGRTLVRWQRAADDFSGAAELNPADTNAVHNAQAVRAAIARLVDTMQKMQQMAGNMGEQKAGLDKALSRLKGQIPASDAPPGSKGESEEESDDGDEPGGVKPEHLAGKKEDVGREGEEKVAPPTPDQAGQMLDGLPVDGSRRLPMLSNQQGAPSPEKKGRDW